MRQWLHERASMLRYMYIACLVIFYLLFYYLFIFLLIATKKILSCNQFLFPKALPSPSVLKLSIKVS